MEPGFESRPLVSASGISCCSQTLQVSEKPFLSVKIFLSSLYLIFKKPYFYEVMIFIRKLDRNNLRIWQPFSMRQGVQGVGAITCFLFCSFSVILLLQWLVLLSGLRDLLHAWSCWSWRVRKSLHLQETGSWSLMLSVQATHRISLLIFLLFSLLTS